MSEQHIRVTFSEEAYEAIRRLAEKQDRTMSGVVRRALALAVWVDEQEQKGCRILTEKDGKYRELVWR